MNGKMVNARGAVALLAGVICTSFAGNTWARQTTGTVVAMEIRALGNAPSPSGSNNTVIVRLSVDPTGTSCASSGFTNYFAFNADDPRGRNILSVLTSASLAGQTVTVIGTGSCGTYLFNGTGTVSVETMDRISL